MRYDLKLHPDCRCEAASAIAVDMAEARDGSLDLHYIVTGTIGQILLPAAAAPGRADELWRHTCFEAFVLARAGYYEFNFSPSSQWAAYRFDSYRAGMRPARGAPRIAVTPESDALAVRVGLDLPEDATGPFALTAVIEETDGRLSYWALRHAPGKPDFHSPEGFCARVAM